jgi:glycine cleavage system H lipoate-binding protein
MVAILVLLTILAFLTLDHLAHQRALKGAAVAPSPPKAAWPDPVAVPPGLFWSPWHTWAMVEPRGDVRVGVGLLPVAALGGIERIDAPAPGREVRAGDTVATLHRGARRIHLRAPIAGRIDATNPRLAHAPDTLDRDPFGEGWLCSIRPRGLANSLHGLRVAEDARDWMRGEFRRVCDFLALLRLRDPARPAVAMADGGVPVAGFADALGDPEWNELVERLFGAQESEKPVGEEAQCAPRS